MDVSDEELEHVKQLVRFDNRDAVVNGKMTVEGFLALMMRFFEKAQFQTIWEVLRQYGYTNDLRLYVENVRVSCELQGRTKKKSRISFFFSIRCSRDVTD